MFKLKISILVLVIMVICFSCDAPQGTSVERSVDGYNIKTIDSCEYIEYDYGVFNQRVYSLTHKGNCKYCAERTKNYIKELALEIKNN